MKNKLIVLGLIVLVIVASGILLVVFKKNKATTQEEFAFDNQELIKQSNENQEELPALLPTDFPVYPGSVVVSNWTNQSQDKIGVSVVWKTDDDKNEVFEYLLREIESKYNVQVSSQNDSHTASFLGDGGFGIIAVTDDEEGGTIISGTISYSVKDE